MSWIQHDPRVVRKKIALPQPHNRGGGEDSNDGSRNGIQEPTTCFHCLRYERSEEMKAWRRLVGDRGGIKFQGKLAKVRDDGCVNTITNVLKDNLILENYERLQRD